MTVGKDTMYQPVDAKETLDDDAEDAEFLRENSRVNHGRKGFDAARSRCRPLATLITIINLIFFITATVMIHLSYRNIRGIEANRNNKLIKLTSAYSPIFDKLPISLTNVKQNGTFWPQNPPSPFRLPPSPEVDAAWERLADTKGLAFTASELIAMGKDPSQSWPWPSDYRIPNHPNNQEKTYMALPNVFHQIHCLNMMRKFAHLDYYGEFWTHSSSWPVQEHLSHCQYMLLQNLMCHADLEIITFEKVRGTPGPFPDFGVTQKCRDWDAILKWKEDNQVITTPEQWDELSVTPEGIRELDPEGRTLPDVGEPGVHF